MKRNTKGEFSPTGKSNCIPLTHPQILNYFNSYIRKISDYYSCVHNKNELWSIVRFLNYSCALILARKYKLKTLTKTFKRFGRDLESANKSGKKYKILWPDNSRTLPTKERFRVNETSDIDQLLSQTWSNSLTFSQFDEPHLTILKRTIQNLLIAFEWKLGRMHNGQEFFVESQFLYVKNIISYFMRANSLV